MLLWVLLPVEITHIKYFMDSSFWPENLPSNRKKAIQELSQGYHLTNKLKEMLRRPDKIETDLKSVDDVVLQILGMFDNTLSILGSCSFNEASKIQTSDMGSLSSCEGLKLEESDESVKIATPVKVKRGCYKRRKNSWTSTQVTSVLIDDGHAWRKYGQKVILNHKHQRNYYRCTHKYDQQCQATKQVQMTDEEPPKYNITYNGRHTCKNLLRGPQIILDSPNPSDTSVILNFETKNITKKKQVNAHFPSMKQEPNEGLSVLGLRHNESSLPNHYQSSDLIKEVQHVSSEAVSMVLDYEDMISSEVYSSRASTIGYGMDDMLESNMFDDFPFEL